MDSTPQVMSLKKQRMQGKLYLMYRLTALKLTCRVVAAKALLSSAILAGIFGFATTILFLFCVPDLNTLFSLNAPQPFVLVYEMALGKIGCVFMTIIAVLGMILVSD